jgi:beta-N-acetylhexosaminidase
MPVRLSGTKLAATAPQGGELGTEDNDTKQGNGEGASESRVAMHSRSSRSSRWYKSPVVWILIILSITVIGAGTVGAYKLISGSSDDSADASADMAASTVAEEEPLTGTELLVSEMSLEQKVGQMMMVGFEGTVPDENITSMIQERQIGGLIIFDRNIETNDQVAIMNEALQQLAVDGAHPAKLMIAVDQEGGKTRRFDDIGPFYSEPMIGEMPEEAALQTARLQAGSTARDLRAIGINTNLAPVLDVSGGWGTVMDVRSYGTDTEWVAQLGAEAVSGYVNASTISCPKHFPGLGSADDDPEEVLPSLDYSYEDIVTLDLPPFTAAIQAGAPMIMVTHLAVPVMDQSGTPASLSAVLTTDLLRTNMGFEGVIITDDLEMGAITENLSVSDAAVAAVEAGADIVMIAHTLDEQIAVYDALLEAVDTGQITEDRINESVVRILDMNNDYRLGLQETGIAATGPTETVETVEEEAVDE